MTAIGLQCDVRWTGHDEPCTAPASWSLEAALGPVVFGLCSRHIPVALELLNDQGHEMFIVQALT